MLKEFMTQKLPFLQMAKRNKTAETGELETESQKETPAAALEPAVPPPESGSEADFQAGMAACKEKNYGEAMIPLLRAAEAGHKEAQFLCGQLYQRGLTGEADSKQALTWYKRSAKQGYLHAQLACAAMYEAGTGTNVNIKRALYWYEQAAKQGAVDAQLKCGKMYYCGRAETRNPKKARTWLEAAAGQGCGDAQKLLQEFF